MTKDSTSGTKYTNVTFTGQLLLGAVGASDKTVLLLCNSTGTWTQVASNITDASGYYFFTVNRTESGTLFYKPRFDVP